MAEAIFKITRKEYSFHEAVKRAAAQNAARAFYNGETNIATYDEMPPVLRSMYVQEARHLLRSTGENTLPMYPHFEHICVRPPLRIKGEYQPQGATIEVMGMRMPLHRR